MGSVDEDQDKATTREKRSIWEFVEVRGCWIPDEYVQGVMEMQHEFQARDGDIILASSVKTGTTWMKALIFAIVNYHNTERMRALEQKNPHELVFTMEHLCFGPPGIRTLSPSALSEMPSPRLLNTHVPYALLPNCLRTKGRVVYIARNPKDTFVSLWHFYNKIWGVPPLEEAFDMFCSGVCHYGPFLDHVLGYWHAARLMPNFFFFTYEDLQADFVFHCRRLIHFLGYSSSISDEDVAEIRDKCRIESLSNNEGNKNEHISTTSVKIKKDLFFRRGTVGDWKIYFTPEMNQRMDDMIKEKLKDSGLQFTYELF